MLIVMEFLLILRLFVSVSKEVSIVSKMYDLDYWGNFPHLKYWGHVPGLVQSLRL